MLVYKSCSTKSLINHILIKMGYFLDSTSTSFPNLSGQVVLVTGGGRGLGRAFAQALAASGMRVAITARHVNELEETARLIRSSGHTVIAFPADINDKSSIEEVVVKVEAQLGPIDLLINNAGICPPEAVGPTWTLDPISWWKTFETNVRGSLNCFNALVPRMIERGRGRVIFVASSTALRGISYMSAYTSSKAALIRLSENLALEVQDYGISVFSIHPGTVRTAMAEGLMCPASGIKYIPWFKKIFDEHRDEPIGPAANLVLYLASGKADALSGRLFMASRGAAKDVENASTILKDDLNVLRVHFLD
jgi:3-oxoacyl-[acyl-carrier protein] reductase